MITINQETCNLCGICIKICHEYCIKIENRSLCVKTDLELLAKLLVEGRIKAVIDRRYTLDKTAEAMKYLSEGHARGKVIINV